MTKDVRNWRDAKLPSWVKESIAEDMQQMALKAALAWPTEAKPEPLPFQWGDYDLTTGNPIPGSYWVVSIGKHVEAFDLAISADLQDDDKSKLIKRNKWAFRSKEIGKWSSCVIRGPLFASEHEARLYRLWLLCEEAAKTLKKARENLE